MCEKIKTQDQIVEVLILSDQVWLHQVFILSTFLSVAISAGMPQQMSAFLEEFCPFVFLFNIQELVTYCGRSRV